MNQKTIDAKGKRPTRKRRPKPPDDGPGDKNQPASNKPGQNAPPAPPPPPGKPKTLAELMAATHRTVLGQDITEDDPYDST